MNGDLSSVYSGKLWLDTHGDKQRPLKAGKGDKRQFPPMNGEVKRLEMIIYIRIYIYI